jgi:hypothetical protein
MKKLALVIATFVPALVAGALAGSAQAGELILREPYSLVIRLCNGHDVRLEGTQLLVGSEKRTPSGGFSLSVHVFPVDVRGVDPLDGTSSRCRRDAGGRHGRGRMWKWQIGRPDDRS